MWPTHFDVGHLKKIQPFAKQKTTRWLLVVNHFMFPYNIRITLRQGPGPQPAYKWSANHLVAIAKLDAFVYSFSTDRVQTSVVPWWLQHKLYYLKTTFSKTIFLWRKMRNLLEYSWLINYLANMCWSCQDTTLLTVLALAIGYLQSFIIRFLMVHSHLMLSVKWKSRWHPRWHPILNGWYLNVKWMLA